MRKKVFGRQLKRDVNERKALFKNLLSSLVLHGRIQTTEAKAKAIKGDADKLITRVKKNGTNLFSLLQQHVNSGAAQRLIMDFGKRFENRTSGYTRILKIGNRLSDNASMVLLEWTEGSKVQSSRLATRAELKVQSDDQKKTKKEVVQEETKVTKKKKTKEKEDE